jgi:hypothetical protein
LFSSIFTILFLYNIFSQEMVTVNVQQPTKAMYEQLVAFFALSLQCPCTQVSVPYSSFAQLNIVLHQICSSPFVQMTWIESIFGDGNWSNLAANDFRSRGVVYFQVLQTLCNMIQEKTSDALSYTLSGSINNVYCIPEAQVLSQINQDVTAMSNTFTFFFVSLLQVVRDSTHDNQLLNIYSSNWVFGPRYGAKIPDDPIFTQPVSHGPNCSCAISPTCTEPIFLDGQIIPGFVLGCIPLESLLRSTLLCLYNQTCIDLININNLPSIRPLDASSFTRFELNTTVDELAMDMFVEEWSLNVSYSNYFNECKPTVCSYWVSQRKNTLQLVTILLGIYGGLTTILYVVVPYLIIIFHRIMLKIWKRNDVVVPYLIIIFHRIMLKIWKRNDVVVPFA